MPFWQYFKKGWDGPQKRILGLDFFLFVLGADEYVERLESQIWKYSILFCWNVLKKQCDNAMLCYVYVIRMFLVTCLKEKSIIWVLRKKGNKGHVLAFLNFWMLSITMTSDDSEKPKRIVMWSYMFIHRCSYIIPTSLFY